MCLLFAIQSEALWSMWTFYTVSFSDPVEVKSNDEDWIVVYPSFQAQSAGEPRAKFQIESDKYGRFSTN